MAQANIITDAGEPVESVVQPYSYQRRFVQNKSRFRVVMWSRQVGKSFGAALLVNDDILEVESTGRRTLWTLISRSLPQARELALKVRNIGRAVMAALNVMEGLDINEKTGHRLNETMYEIRYPGGSRVVVVSGDPDSAAGYTGNVLWDEAALTKRAQELFGTAFPVVSRNNARFIITSTPRPGFFRRMWDEAQKPGSVWDSEKLTIYEAVEQGCPQDPEILKAALRNDELRWKQEFLCEFIDDEICWLPWDMIVAITDDRASMEPEDTTNPIFAGWDVARWNDLSVFYLLERLGSQLVTRGVVIMKRMPFSEQIDLILRTIKRYPGFVRLCVDATGMGEMPAEYIAERLPGRVEGVKFTNEVKAVLAGDVRRLAEDRTWRVPDNDEVRGDLHSIRCTTTAAGNKRFEGETPGSHADIFWSGALAIHAALDEQTGAFEGMAPDPDTKFGSLGDRSLSKAGVF